MLYALLLYRIHMATVGVKGLKNFCKFLTIFQWCRRCINALALHW